jgi:hypothetical protein
VRATSRWSRRTPLTPVPDAVYENVMELPSAEALVAGADIVVSGLL